jgi:alkyl hydroperoxide reductase subunit F
MSEVERIEPGKDGFEVVTSDLNKYFASTLIVATGMTRRKLNVPGEERFQRKGIFYGNIQDWSFVQDSDVAVIGGGNSALQVVENLHTVAKNIYLISNTKLTADPAIIERVNQLENLCKYEEFKVIEFAGEDTLTNVTIRRKAEETTTTLSAKGVFIAIGLQPNSSLVAHMVKHNDRGEININPDCSTSCPGIYAAGDVTDAFGKRIIIASGEGAKAAMAARKYILSRKRKGVQL